MAQTSRIHDDNGWYEVQDNPLSRVGVFQYSGRSIGLAGSDGDKIWNVYRPESELSDPETLNSFRLVPFINNHTMLGKATPDAIPAEQKGVQGVIGDKVYYDPTDRMMKGNLKVFSDSQQKLIDSGKVDLSLGYKCRYDPTPGVFEGASYDFVQRRLRGNHVANVDDGRMGDAVSVMDAVTFDTKDIVKMPTEKLSKRNPKAFTAISKLLTSTYLNKLDATKPIATMDAEEAAAVDSDPTLADVVDLLGDVMPQIAAINEAMAVGDPDDDMEAEMDAAGKPVMDAAGKPVMKKKVAVVDKKVDPEDKKDEKAMDQVTMDAAIEKATAPLLAEIAKLKTDVTKTTLSEIGQRDKLASSLSKHIGTFDHSEMTLHQVAKYGVEKLSIPTVDGQEVSSVTAWLHDRVAPKPTFGMDSRSDPNRKSSVDAWLNAAE